MKATKDVRDSMLEQLREKLEQYVGPLMVKKGDQEGLLVHLEDKRRQYARLAREARTRQESLRRELSEASTSGESIIELRQELSETAGEIKELEAALREIENKTLPAARKNLDATNAHIRLAINGALVEARAPFYQDSKATLRKLSALNAAWTGTARKVLSESGLYNLVPNSNLERLLPSAMLEIEGLAEGWE